MGTCQRELCLIVVKNGALPPAGVVAQRAILRESRRLVIGLLVLLKSARWHEAQSAGVPANRLLAWH